jgi:hypothetical protein
MEKIKNFFYPNKGILGVFAVWAILSLVSLIILQDTTAFIQTLIINLAVMYFLSCLSIWVYEKMKKKK